MLLAYYKYSMDYATMDYGLDSGQKHECIVTISNTKEYQLQSFFLFVTCVLGRAKANSCPPLIVNVYSCTTRTN